MCYLIGPKIVCREPFNEIDQEKSVRLVESTDVSFLFVFKEREGGRHDISFVEDYFRLSSTVLDQNTGVQSTALWTSIEHQEFLI